MIHRDRYNPSLVIKVKLVTFELLQLQIKIEKIVSILIIHRPPYSRGNQYTGFKFAEELGISWGIDKIILM